MDRIIPGLVTRYKTNDPFRIAKHLNIIIRYATFEDGTRGLYYRVLRRRFIVIHNQLDENWQRFVCAHELAHDRLHAGIGRFWSDEHSLLNPGKYERQANIFAIKLLTATDVLGDGESIHDFLQRNSIPKEMYKFYD